MDYIDPFEDFIDALPPARASFGREGIRIEDLHQSGVELEVDPDAFSPNGEEERREFNQEEVWKHINPDCMQAPDALSDTTTPFLHMESLMEDLTGDGKVFKNVLRTGVGPIVPEGATIRIHYNGYLEYSDEPYDSTRLRNKPLTIRLGKQQVIPGLEVGVANMRKSELARILIKSDYAFGKMGCPPRIPPEASILYEVEVLSFIDHKAADNYQELPEEERANVTLNDLIDVANSEREAGNDFFEQRIYGRATQCYLKAIHMLETSRLKDDEEEKKWRECLLKLYLNLSLCNLKRKKPKPAITNCRRALEFDENNIKATFRLGKAFSMLGEWDESKKYMLKAIHLSPNNSEIRQELAKLDRKMKEFEVIERGIYSRMFQETPSASLKKGDGISKELKALFQEKIELFQKNYEMNELVLPVGTSAEEIECIEEIVEQLGSMTTVRGNQRSQFSLKVVKPDLLPPEEEEL